MACFISGNIGKFLELRQNLPRFSYIHCDHALDPSTGTILNNGNSFVADGDFIPLRGLYNILNSFIQSFNKDLDTVQSILTDQLYQHLLTSILNRLSSISTFINKVQLYLGCWVCLVNSLII